MSIQQDPEKAVSTLQKRLFRAMDLAEGPIDESTKETEVVSTYQKIDDTLNDLKIYLPGVKNWQDKLMERFNELRLQISRTLMHAEKKDGRIRGDLLLVKDKIKELNDALQPPAPPDGKGSQESREKRSQFEKAPERKILIEWQEQEVENIMFQSAAVLNLQASYYNLDKLDLRLCFLFFSVFPENAVMKKRPLIYWWIGEGLITTDGDKTAEEEGERIFEQLIELELIMPYHKEPDKPSPVVNACKMHPWIRRMAISLAQKADLFHFDSSGTASYDNSGSRRACLVLGGHNSFVDGNARKEENLLTVFNVSEKYLDFYIDWLPKLKKATVLQLGRWHHSPEHHIEVEKEEVFRGLGALKNLKYLSLRGISLITTLPSSISELFSLEILDLKACHNLEELPSEIGSLRRLTHLDVSYSPFLERMPQELQKLTNLQVLKGFVIGSSKSCKLADLARLKELRRLSIYIGNEARVQDGEFTKLKDFKKLRCLAIWWEVKHPKLPAMTNLSFPQGLEKLDLKGIPQLDDSDPPEVLKPSALKKLNRLYIRGGKFRKLNYGETEWQVEILRLKYLEHFKIEWEKLEVAFPRLKYLEVKCDKSVEDKYEEDRVLTSRVEIEKYLKDKEKSRTKEKFEKNIMSTRSEIHGKKPEKEDDPEENELTNKAANEEQASSSNNRSFQ